MSKIAPNYQFTYSRLSSSSETKNTQPYFRINLFYSKLPHISHEDFYEHLCSVHADILLATEEWPGCFLRQTYIRQTPELKAKAEGLGMKMLDYDGSTELWLRRLEDWETYTATERFRNIVCADSNRLIMQPLVFYVGQEDLIYGDKIENIGGKPGILAEELKTKR